MNEFQSFIEKNYDLNMFLGNAVRRLKKINFPSLSEIGQEIKKDLYSWVSLSSSIAAGSIMMYGGYIHYMLDNPPTSFVLSHEFDAAAIFVILGIGTGLIGTRVRKKKILSRLQPYVQ